MKPRESQTGSNWFQPINLDLEPGTNCLSSRIPVDGSSKWILNPDRIEVLPKLGGFNSQDGLTLFVGFLYLVTLRSVKYHLTYEWFRKLKTRQIELVARRQSVPGPWINYFVAQFFREAINVASVAERVVNIVAEQLGVEKDKITPETSFVNDLGADSLDTVELVMELEEEFDINIPDDAAEKIQTVGQAIEHIENEIASSSS